MRVGGRRHETAALLLGKRPGNGCTRAWVDFRAGLEGSRKSRPPLGPDRQTVHPVAICCNDYSTLAIMKGIKVQRNSF